MRDATWNNYCNSCNGSKCHFIGQVNLKLEHPPPQKKKKDKNGKPNSLIFLTEWNIQVAKDSHI